MRVKSSHDANAWNLLHTQNKIQGPQSWQGGTMMMTVMKVITIMNDVTMMATLWIIKVKEYFFPQILPLDLVNFDVDEYIILEV